MIYFNRAKFLERQTNVNYENEYDRLVGELSRANITNNPKRTWKNERINQQKYMMIIHR